MFWVLYSLACVAMLFWMAHLVIPMGKWIPKKEKKPFKSLIEELDGVSCKAIAKKDGNTGTDNKLLHNHPTGSETKTKEQIFRHTYGRKPRLRKRYNYLERREARNIYETCRCNYALGVSYFSW